MSNMEISWGIAAVWIGLALLASVLSIRFKLSVALVEILVGVAVGNLALFWVIIIFLAGRGS